MTYGQAKKDFVLFAVFAPVKTKKGKTKWEEVNPDKEKIADDAEGRVGFTQTWNYSASRLCFILKEEME